MTHMTSTSDIARTFGNVIVTTKPWLYPLTMLPVVEQLMKVEITFTPVKPSSWSEEELHYATWENRRREKHPPVVTLPPVGTWARSTSTFGFMAQLQEIPVRAIEGRENPNAALVEKYVGWMNAGHNPPPIRVSEFQGQGGASVYRITDGHHRAAAARTCGKETLVAWVSPYYQTDKVSLEHDHVIIDALYRGEHVPMHVVLQSPPALRVYKAIRRQVRKGVRS